MSLHGLVTGKPPIVDFDLERRVQAVTREGIRQGWLRSAHDCSEGGIVVALAESCIASQLGAQINLGLTDVETRHGASLQGRRWDEVLFGESASRILVSVAPEHQLTWESYLNEQLGEQAHHWQNIGIVQPKNAEFKVFTANNQPIINVTMADISDRFSNAIARRLEV
jgi:phosphoribosylformylglycinamidine synthase